jgi:hypothetical protein
MKSFLALVVGMASFGLGACSGPGATPLSPSGATTPSPFAVAAAGTSGVVERADRSGACDRYAEQLRQAVRNGRITTDTARRLYSARCGDAPTSR